MEVSNLVCGSAGESTFKQIDDRLDGYRDWSMRRWVGQPDNQLVNAVQYGYKHLRYLNGTIQRTIYCITKLLSCSNEQLNNCHIKTIILMHLAYNRHLGSFDLICRIYLWSMRWLSSPQNTPVKLRSALTREEHGYHTQPLSTCLAFQIPIFSQSDW